VLFLPVSLVITLLQGLVLGESSILGVEDQGQAAGTFALIVFAIGTALTLLGIGLVQAASAEAMIEIDAGRPIRPLDAYRMAFRHARVLLKALVLAVVIVTLLTSSVFLVPIAIWVAVRWSLIAPVIAVEDVGVAAALRRSGALVRGDWLKIGSLTVVSGGIALVLGPLIGTTLILTTSLPLALLNVIAGVVYMLTMPFVGLTTTYAYFDVRVSDQMQPPPQPDVLPAEAGLSPS
jgi:hypothetical protein